VALDTDDHAGSAGDAAAVPPATCRHAVSSSPAVRSLSAEGRTSCSGAREPSAGWCAPTSPAFLSIEPGPHTSLISTVPDLAASATIHYDAWERAVADFVARRTGQPTDSLYPLTVGRSVLATCRAAYERWSDADLAVYLEAALKVLAAGFADPVLTTEPDPPAERG
jgi:hypothetical protein